MRVIGGEFKRTAIYGPDAGDTSIRPSHDRTRENVFNILSPVISGANVLDLFAGCGAIGVEALSRGARRVVFVENTSKGAGLIKKNVDLLGMSDRCSILRVDAVRYVERLGASEKFDVVYIDPPYGSGLVDKVIEALGNCGSLAEGATVIGEQEKAPSMDRAGRLELTDTRKYSRKTTISIWKLSEGE